MLKFAKHPRIKLLLKILVSSVVMWLILGKMSMSEIFASFTHMNYGYGLAIFVLVVAGMYLQSERWRRLVLLPDAAKPSNYDFFRYTTIGFFFNLFLPTGFGGDAVRSLSLGRKFQMVGKSVASTIVARLLGLQTLILFMLVGSLFLSVAIPAHIVRVIQTCGIAFLFVSGMLWFLIFNRTLISDKRMEMLSHKVPMLASLMEYRSFPRLFAIAFFDSMLLQVVILATNWLMFLALDLPMPFVCIVTIFPMVTLATMIPISFFGIGLREWAALSLYTYIPGISNSSIMAALMLGYGYMLLQAFAGMAFWLGNRKAT